MKKWLAVGIVSLIVLCLALVLAGGIYRTVNAGGRGLYVVNRFTGKAYPLINEETPQNLTPAEEIDRAIQLAKDSDELGGGMRIDNAFEIREIIEEMKGPVTVLGWKAEKKEAGLYLVSFTFQHPQGPVSGFFWEVNTKEDIVRLVSGDTELGKHYGFTEEVH